MNEILAMIRRTRVFTLLNLELILLLLLTPYLASAQAPEQTEAFVYGINAAVPEAVVGTFAPPVVDHIFLLTGQTSILSPRRTMIYYWPITNEYRASWSRRTMPVDLPPTYDTRSGR